MNEFKDRLREAINKKGITASELSRISGIGKSDISNYLNGKYLAKQDKVYRLAKALDVDPGWLITGVLPNKNIEEQAKVIIPDSKLFVKLIKYMPQEEYLMVMEAFSKANKLMQEKEVNDD